MGVPEDIGTWLAIGVTAAAAVAAALLGNRYLHLLEVREAHHRDLSERVLRPWRGFAERQAFLLTWHGLRDWATTDLPRGAVFDFPDTPWPITHSQSQSPAYLPMETPLWERSKEHWGSTHAMWAGLRAPLEETKRLALEGLGYVEDKLKAHAGQVRWQFDREDIALNGLRVEALNLWRWLMDSEFDHFPRQRMYEVAERPGGMGRDDARLLVVGGGSDLATGQRNSLEHLKATLESLPRDPGLKAMLQKAAHEAGRTREGFLKFAQHLEQLEYDRNLAGKCAFCPVWFPSAYGRGRGRAVPTVPGPPRRSRGKVR